MTKEHNIKRSKKIRNLVVLCCMFGILLSASTYAWFIGMKTVSVNKFDIDIATTEGLFLSMNGKDWSYSLAPTDPETKVYVNNANTFAPDGLIPMSSVGDMDITSSRMKLYQKASLTAVTGGYRFLASRVDNYSKTNTGGIEYTEGKGYVAFDLFIKNLSGEEYYPENNPLNEEAIYLTPESSVKVSINGVANTGIENSVRVGFVQLGRVIADGTVGADAITKITCADNELTADGNAKNDVTGICRNATIWEPNDTKHVQNAINWYNESCLTRKAGPDGETVNSSNSYNAGVQCQRIEPETGTGLYESIPTYAISRELTVGDNVNIYDGERYNTYFDNTITYEDYLLEEEDEDGVKQNAKLVEFPYFTDTMKNIAGADRPEFMTLAPNSITKVRVYVWIEGQDIDNYDFAQLGKEISIKFGFTKERYYGEDVDHEGPELPEDVVKTTKVSYVNTGVVAATDTEITFDDDKDEFSVPKWYETFTFKDGSTDKVATFNSETDTWDITDKS